MNHRFSQLQVGDQENPVVNGTPPDLETVEDLTGIVPGGY
jgi:hypothetical protein